MTTEPDVTFTNPAESVVWAYTDVAPDTITNRTKRAASFI
jgi:hypothetical protein